MVPIYVGCATSKLSYLWGSVIDLFQGVEAPWMLFDNLGRLITEPGMDLEGRPELHSTIPQPGTVLSIRNQVRSRGSWLSISGGSAQINKSSRVFSSLCAIYVDLVLTH